MNAVQYYLRELRPKLLGRLTRWIYSRRNVNIGRGLRCDSIPRILIDKGAFLTMGNNVELRRNVEIRVHGKAEISIGDRNRIDRGVRILAANEAKITLADGVRIGLYSVLNGGDSISVGTKSLISGFVYLQTSMHGFKNKELLVQDQGYDHAPIELGEDCWLGTHVVILPGVVLGKGVVVGGNAVVNKSFDNHRVVGGIPAKEIKERT